MQWGIFKQQFPLTVTRYSFSWISISNCLNYFVKIHRWNALILESSFKIDFAPKCASNDNVSIYSQEHLLCACTYFHIFWGLLNNNAAIFSFLEKIYPACPFSIMQIFDLKYWPTINTSKYTIIQNFRCNFFLAHCGTKVCSCGKKKFLA